MAIHRYILHNGEIREASEARLCAGQLGLLSGWGVFSTLRVEDGQLFAWERHWSRMSNDARLMNVPMPDGSDLLVRDLTKLLAANDIAGQHAGKCTVRIVVVRNGGGLWEGPAHGNKPDAASDVIALTANMKQWPESVRLDIQPHGRYAASDFCRAKILSWAHNLRWAERAQENGFDETVLLNERGLVAECTSANIFAVFGNEIVTPPLTDGCLPGITREVVLNEIGVPGVGIQERSLSVEDLRAADEVFITSSTRDLLAVRELAGQSLNRRGDVRERLSLAFQKFVREDVARRGKAALAA
jgi:branched-chain amino acid aminotransferase